MAPHSLGTAHHVAHLAPKRRLTLSGPPKKRVTRIQCFKSRSESTLAVKIMTTHTLCATLNHIYINVREAKSTPPYPSPPTHPQPIQQLVFRIIADRHPFNVRPAPPAAAPTTGIPHLRTLSTGLPAAWPGCKRGVRPPGPWSTGSPAAVVAPRNNWYSPRPIGHYVGGPDRIRGRLDIVCRPAAAAGRRTVARTTLRGVRP